MIPASTPARTTLAATTAATTNSSGRRAQHATHARDVDQFDPDQEHDRGQYGVRHVLDRSRQEHQHDEHDQRRGHLRQLAAPPGTVDHLGLRRAAVDHERPGHAGHGTGRSETDQVDVLVEFVVVLRGVGAGRGRALGEDDDDDRPRDAEERSHVGPRHVGQAERREAARQRAHRRHAVGGEIGGPTHDDRADHRDQRARNPPGHRLQPDDHADDARPRRRRSSS